MKPQDHLAIDARLLQLTEAVIRKIETDPSLALRLAENVERWPNLQLQAQWRRRLQLPWSELRQQLLANTENGAALRPDAPLGGILSPAERSRIMQTFNHDAGPA